MTRGWRSTIRVRLTLLYAGAFFFAGAALMALTYVYLGHPLDHRSLVSLAFIAVVAGGSGWLLAGRALRPLQRITATARRVAERSLHERIALDGPDDEIKDLADTFDAMLERLDRSFDGQRRFVANASHELRTPLAINRTLIEVALDTPVAARSRGPEAVRAALLSMSGVPTASQLLGAHALGMAPDGIALRLAVLSSGRSDHGRLGRVLRSGLAGAIAVLSPTFASAALLAAATVALCCSLD